MKEGILWDPIKNEWLKKNRGISFEKIRQVIELEKYITIIDNPARENQLLCILELRGYTYVVPFIIGHDGNLILKTAYPSRKYHKIYTSL